MLIKEKSIKDNTSPAVPIVNDKGLDKMSIRLSYTKTNKLITALYMVTDIMDKEEPLRNRLRTLGVEILSDIYSNFAMSKTLLNTLDIKIIEVLSFLDIALTISLISEMNCNILKKEFSELKKSIVNLSQKANITLHQEVNLLEFFKNEDLTTGAQNTTITKFNSIGHTRIGVQKGSTLMEALSDIKISRPINKNSFSILKKQRQNQIINIIKERTGEVGIKDMVLAIQNLSEKTLQRELASLVKDNILKKTGKKRWSRYSLHLP